MIFVVRACTAVKTAADINFKTLFAKNRRGNRGRNEEIHDVNIQSLAQALERTFRTKECLILIKIVDEVSNKDDFLCGI